MQLAKRGMSEGFVNFLRSISSYSRTCDLKAKKENSRFDRLNDEIMLFIFEQNLSNVYVTISNTTGNINGILKKIFLHNGITSVEGQPVNVNEAL